MIRIAAVVVSLMLVGGSASAAGAPSLHIVNDGSTARFVTLNLSPDSFTLGPGEVRHFNKLKPGRYVVYQGPPLPGPLQIDCSNGQGNEVILAVGDDVTCTFIHD